MVKSLREALHLPVKLPFQRDGDADGRAYYAILDVGTEVAKALVLVVADGRGEVLGVGRRPQGQLDMQDGLVTDIEAVVENCHLALQEAEEMAGVVGRDAIVGMAGELTKGLTTTATIERARPAEKLTVAEIESVLRKVQQQALEQAMEQISWETGLSDIDVRLVNSAVVAVHMDGHAVSNPIGFQGRHLTVTVFNAFAPLVHVGAMRTVVEALDLELLSVVAEPYAVASALTSRPVLDYGGVVIDIGGGTTDVALLRHGGIEGTKTFPLGGRAFTKRLAMRRSLDFDTAETLKLRYAHGELDPTESAWIPDALASDVQTWLDGVLLLLEELAGNGQIPPHVYLCGGSSGLPDLPHILRRCDWTAHLPMSRAAEVKVLTPPDVGPIQDTTGELTGPQDVTPLGLAYQALALEQESGIVTEALQQTVHRMGI